MAAFMGLERRPDDDLRPLSITELNERARDRLEASFPAVWVVGEVSRPNRAPSGHWYFTLKDQGARVDAVLWARQARGLRFRLVEGLEVRARGQLTVYPPQGRFQLVCSQVEPEGEGALRAAFLRLKARLDAEGLTAVERKRRLPFLPRAVGLVTSPTGAAVHDMIEVIRRRFAPMRIILCPVRVQGDGAAAEVARGIERLNRHGVADVIIAGRGGGSIEDLWTFNDEALARAIAASAVPVVSAVGHEIDVTIADLVADARARTPSEAGELVVPLLAELREELARAGARLGTGLRRSFREVRGEVEALGRRPALRLFPRRLEDLGQQLDLLELGLRRGLVRELAGRGRQLTELGRVLQARSPSRWVLERRRDVGAHDERLDRAARKAVHVARSALGPLSRALEALNPLAVLARGFSVTRVELPDGSLGIARDAAALPPGSRALTAFAAGDELRVRVEEHRPRTLPEAGTSPLGDGSEEGR
jgi:exodeoxyribonuclease VII large subunit